jgi:putative glutamine amidotransferase
MPESKPRIGVTRWADVPDDVRDRYWARVTEAGGEVVDLDESAQERVAELAPSLDGLVLTGGIDVDPAIYGAERHPKVKQTAPDRDRMEIAYLSAVAARDVPVLAICRGHQVLNVGFGGTLVQHIDSGEHRADFGTPGYPSRWHDVELLPDSRLAGVFVATRFEINSRHHQAVDAASLAPGLRPVGFSDDHGHRLIEGMESEQHHWVVGVQWHPERPEEHKAAFAPLMRRLFEAFITQVRTGS